MWSTIKKKTISDVDTLSNRISELEKRVNKPISDVDTLSNRISELEERVNKMGRGRAVPTGAARLATSPESREKNRWGSATMPPAHLPSPDKMWWMPDTDDDDRAAHIWKLYEEAGGDSAHKDKQGNKDKAKLYLNTLHTQINTWKAEEVIKPADIDRNFHREYEQALLWATGKDNEIMFAVGGKRKLHRTLRKKTRRTLRRKPSRTRRRR